MPFPWKKHFPNISYLRIKRSKRSDRTQRTSGDIEGDASDPPAGSNTHRIQSTLRTVSDVAQTVLPGVAAVAGVIPVAGSPLQAAIGGLLFILQGIDRSRQNTQGIDDLELLLEELRSCLDSAPNTTDPRELGRRNVLTRVLENTKFELENNMNAPGFTYTARATQVIAGCSNKINTYLLVYLASSQMGVQNGVGAIITMMQSNQSPGIFTLQCVTLVDATGDEHTIPMKFCHSFKQLSMVLGAIFEVESDRARIQRQYLEAGQYNLSIDRSTEVAQLTNDYWPTIEPATKIVMSIVAKQRQKTTNTYQCQGCETWNAVASADETQTLLIDCRVCGRRFQVSTESKHNKEKQPIKITNKESSRIDTTATDIQLIRNWRLETSSQPSGSANGEKKHVCSTCDRGFTTSGHLARHLRIHTGERNHKCPFPGCETSCSRQDDLQRHYRIHLSSGSRRSSSRPSVSHISHPQSYPTHYQTVNTPSPASERNHKCPFPGCETSCSGHDDLQQHYRIHLSPTSGSTFQWQ